LPPASPDPWSPQLLITLANLGRPRRPSGVATAVVEPPLPNADGANDQLRAHLPRPVTDAEVEGLRRLREIAADIAEAVLRGATPDVAALNDLARQGHGYLQLAVTDGGFRSQLTWDDESVVGFLAGRLVDELGTLDATRLRECARPECTLLLYDTTRSRTRRWHAEDPCGWRARQQAHRGRG
jgi:predicted RNA-binding Zn ribbon-like protein